MKHILSFLITLLLMVACGRPSGNAPLSAELQRAEDLMCRRWHDGCSTRATVFLLSVKPLSGGDRSGRSKCHHWQLAKDGRNEEGSPCRTVRG